MSWLDSKDIEIKSDFKKCFVNLILSSDNYHPFLTSLIGVYIKPLDSESSYILNLDHPDSPTVTYQEITNILNKFEEIYILDKKKFLYFFNHKNLVDIKLGNLINDIIIDDYSGFSSYNGFYSKYFKVPLVGKIIPLTLHLEYNDKLFNHNKHFLSFEKNSSFKFYNNDYIKVFYLLEQNGIGIDKEKLFKTYDIKNKELNIEGDRIYYWYNLYNTTSRPSNAFNNINFAGIPNKREYKECFKPINDYFVEFDFDSYHLRLIGKIVGYPFKEESAHSQIAKLFYNKEDISKEEYLNVKQMNFQALYGRIPESYRKIKVFNEVKSYIDKVWGTYREYGYAFSPISERKFSTTLEDMNPNKLMNYIMQNYETTRNVNVLKNALRLLSNKKSFISLYTYDSILIDYSKDDGKELLHQLESILSEKNNFPVHYKYGKTLFLD